MLAERLRSVWDDTGWRAAIYSAVLIFLLETFMEIADGSVGSPVGWMAMIIALVGIGRALTLRPLRGDLSVVENRSLLISLVAVILAEVVINWTTVGATFAAEPIFWPFSLLFALTLLASRAIAPYVNGPLDHWLLLFAFVNFWMQAGMWAGNVLAPAPVFTWSVMVTGAALIVRWIVGRGFGGPILSPLNLAVAIFVFLLWWLEYGAAISGAGVTWVQQDLYWPWTLWMMGLATGARIVGSISARRFGDD